MKKAGNAFSRKHTGIKRQKRLAVSGNANTAAGPITSLTADCYEIWDVYYDLITGEIIGEQYIETECTAGSGGGGSGGGGNSGDGTSGSNSNGDWSVIPTSDTEDNSPPADCSSWPFRRVGPNGYMACGVVDIRIDVSSQYEGADGNWHFEYVQYVFSRHPLYFEMPPSYTPEQAANLCATLKDQAETFVENKFGGNSIPPVGSVIESAFYNRLITLIS